MDAAIHPENDCNRSRTNHHRSIVVRNAAEKCERYNPFRATRDIAIAGSSRILGTISRIN